MEWKIGNCRLSLKDTMCSPVMDWKSICRICLEPVCELGDFSSNAVDSNEIWEKISSCFQITLISEKISPCKFCTKCLEDLDTANSLRIKCVTILERLQNCENLSKNFALSANEIDDGICSYENTKESDVRTDNKETFICDVCNKVLKTKHSLSKHMISMHQKRRHAGKVTGFGCARQYHCTTCTYSTPHSQTLVNHMRRHNGERPFKCECGKCFTQASSLAAHRKTHSATTYFTCTECGKQFKHAFSLKTHMRVHSNGIHSCHICNKLLKTKRSLTSHLHRHYKIFNYNCEDCGDTFVTSAELHNHKIKHSSNKNIACHVCKYATHSRKNLIAHLKRHEGDKAHRCIICQKAFLTQANLRRHLRVHTREKPFTCPICTQKFAHSSSLNNHMLTFHGAKYKWGDDKSKESKNKPMK